MRLPDAFSLDRDTALNPPASLAGFLLRSFDYTERRAAPGLKHGSCVGVLVLALFGRPYFHGALAADPWVARLVNCGLYPKVLSSRRAHHREVSGIVDKRR